VGTSIRLGRIAGIEVGVNWSVLIVFVLIAWELATYELPVEAPFQSQAAYWVGGVVTAVIFFLSLLAHEMSHALVAVHDGVGVNGITLWLFGGVARLRSDTVSAASEFRITAVGPLMSFVLAGIFFGVEKLLAGAGVPELYVGVASWLARINAILAAFNLIPGFPLDGGRLLRAVLWRFFGKTRATKAAAFIGQVFGAVMVGTGLWVWVRWGDAGGLWFVFLGWFLFEAARAERSAVLRPRGESDTLVSRPPDDYSTPNR
jgi:Zn-dependent protease